AGRPGSARRSRPRGWRPGWPARSGRREEGRRSDHRRRSGGRKEGLSGPGEPQSKRAEMENAGQISEIAARLIWWQPAKDSLANTPRFLMQVMTLGSWR